MNNLTNCYADVLDSAIHDLSDDEIDIMISDIYGLEEEFLFCASVMEYGVQ